MMSAGGKLIIMWRVKVRVIVKQLSGKQYGQIYSKENSVASNPYELPKGIKAKNRYVKIEFCQHFLSLHEILELFLQTAVCTTAFHKIMPPFVSALQIRISTQNKKRSVNKVCSKKK